MKKVDQIFIEKFSNKGTLTNLFGLNKNIDKKDSVMAPTKEISVQATEQRCHAHAQTDEGSLGLEKEHHHYYGQTKSKQESPGFIIPNSGLQK